MDKEELLKALGESIRTSELSDAGVVKALIVTVLNDISAGGTDVDQYTFAEIISGALIDLGGFHRIAACKW